MLLIALVNDSRKHLGRDSVLTLVLLDILAVSVPTTMYQAGLVLGIGVLFYHYSITSSITCSSSSDQRENYVLADPL